MLDFIFSRPAGNRLGILTVFFLLFVSHAQAQFNIGDPIEIISPYTAGSAWAGATITEPVPPEITYTSCGGAPCFNSSGTVVWALGNVPAGTSGVVTYFATISSCQASAVTDMSQLSVSSPATVILSNQVSFTVNCLTYTPTNSPTITDTPTITPTPTATSTPTITPTPTDTATPTDTPTITDTPTATDSFTPTATPTITDTPTTTDTPLPTATPTATLVPFHLWPNPFNPAYAVDGVLKAYQAPRGSTLTFYTVSGEPITTLPEINGLIEWDGRNKSGRRVASGIYYYVLQNGGKMLYRGKLLIEGG
jgi:hypothetical protein